MDLASSSQDVLECSDDQVHQLSGYCTNSSLTDEEAKLCFPDNIRNLSIVAGIWCIANAIVGFSGNLLTILAIPFAAKRKK